MEQHDKMLSPEEQYAQLAPTLDADGFSLYAAAEEVTGLKVYEEFPYEDNHGMFEMADGHTLLRYLEAAYFGAVTWEIVPGTPYERAILGEVDKTSPEYEGYPRHYTKETVTVKDAAGAELPVMVYIMAEPYCRQPALPSPYYYRVIQRGFEANGLPVESLQAAWDRTVDEVFSGKLDKPRNKKSERRKEPER